MLSQQVDFSALRPIATAPLAMLAPTESYTIAVGPRVYATIAPWPGQRLLWILLSVRQQFGQAAIYEDAILNGSTFSSSSRHQVRGFVIDHIHYPRPNLPPHSLPNSNIAHRALPSATPESPTESTPSKPTTQSTPLPTTHRHIAPTAAKIAAVPYPQSRRIFKASTLFATTAHPRLRAAAGTSYSHMTIKIGNSFVEELTRRAVETEFGRG
jgi:hypothetical protein